MYDVVFGIDIESHIHHIAMLSTAIGDFLLLTLFPALPLTASRSPDRAILSQHCHYRMSNIVAEMRALDQANKAKRLVTHSGTSTGKEKI